MKKLFFLFSILSLLWVVNLNGQTIYSTSSGGNWTDTTTWVGYQIPSASHNVVINGTVQVYGTNSCNNLTVNVGATLKNHSYDHYTCVAYGNIVNNGTIQNNNYNFTIKCYGNIRSIVPPSVSL